MKETILMEKADEHLGSRANLRPIISPHFRY